jgi:ribosomal protein L37AE/L43A
MATFVCPKQHESSEPDYCSECGARIEGAAAEPAAAPAAALPGTCPECGAARDQKDVVFCEICGYNFATGARGEVPAMPPIVAAPPAATPRAWAVELSIDPAMHEAGSPEPPASFAASTVDLKLGLNLIGRRSAARAIHPEIDLSHDTAVSHRHALIEVNAAGAASLRDIGAANGTRLNGKEIEQLKDHPLAAGDAITLGHWSRLVLKALD